MKFPHIKYLKTSIFFLLLFSFCAYLGSFIFSYDAIFEQYNPLLFSDVARIQPEKILSIDRVNSTNQIREIILDASRRGLKVSIAGSRHSQGGHTYYKDTVVIDMRSYNQILSLDIKNNLLTVQAGAKWSGIQEYLNPYNLAVKVMQSSNLFTIGGTLSANAHGRDRIISSVVETVESFRLLTASGETLNVSRDENPELFSSVIGGYGLFGIILDVTLSVTQNELYSQSANIIKAGEFGDYFEKNVRYNTGIAMMLARPSIATDTFFDELVVSTWSYQEEPIGHELKMLTQESNVWRDKFFFGLSRKYDWAKDLRWYLQKRVELSVGKTRLMTRNNSMRPPLAPLEFLEYYSKKDTDIIQEYYIPISQYKSFIQNFQSILRKDTVNVISFTIRYVKANHETLLPYCGKEDCFAIIFMANVGLDQGSQARIEKTTQSLVESAITHSGTYYLTYQLYPTSVQIRAMYPNFDRFITLKKKYDPQELFINKFYKKYENK